MGLRCPVKRSCFHIILFLLVTGPVVAQKPAFYLEFDQILDNREYFTSHGTHQTIFGARINPGISFGFDSVHKVNAGINYMYEYGGELFGVNPQIDLYYCYSSAQLDMKFGSFPRTEVLDYPLFLLTDTLSYYRPNMEGAAVGFSWQWGSIQGWVDWTGREDRDTRESILAGIDATFRAGIIYLKTITTRYHLARTTDPADGNLIRDDGSVVLMAGADLSDLAFPDHLDVSAGWASTYLHDRPADFEWYGGWFSELVARYRIFGLRGSYYLGDPSPLAFGDPLYASGNYGRIDLYVDPFKNPRITSKIGWNLHIIPGDGLYHSQHILISISIR